MRFLSLIILNFTIFSLPLFSQSRTLVFSDPDINSRNEIILKVHNPSPSGADYTALVRGNASGGSSEVLTVYPEVSFFSAAKNELIIYNHFGCFSYADGIWTENRFIPSFSDGLPVSPLSLKPLAISPDGRFVLYLKDDDDLCSLNLYDRDRSVSLTVTDRIPKEHVQLPAKWSPDSRYFIYRRGRELYYFSIDQYLSGRIPAESFRNTGFKDIQSVQWAPGNYLYVLKNRIVYRIHSSEFFTRSFYSDPFRKGVVWGRIPVPYDPVFDRYSIDGKGQNIFLEKNGRNGMVFPLQRVPESPRGLQQTPVMNGSNDLQDSAWLSDGTLLVLLNPPGGQYSELYAYSENRGVGFQKISSDQVSGFSVSPGGDSFALFSSESVDLYDTSSLSRSESFPLKGILDFYWGKSEYLALGEKTITTIDRISGKTAVAGLSQIEKAGFSPGGSLLGFSDGQWYEYEEALSWIPAVFDDIRTARLGTPEYRIYLEPLRGQWYDSSLKIRNVDGFETRDFIPLYHKIAVTGYSMPLTADGKSNPWYFDHGSRNENKEVSLVFNGIDTAEGVGEILKILDNYKIIGTFFLNGDFIHANPSETAQIAGTANTVGSLFYTWFDMSDPGYQIDKTFLKKGLARNEDDYFIATGHEMAQLWHTPYYYINSEILETSESLEYIYVGTDLNIQDRKGLRGWISGTNDDALSLSKSLLEKVQPGSVIPVTLGRSDGQEEYLFQYLPMIIEDLLARGYSIVPLTELIRNSR